MSPVVSVLLAALLLVACGPPSSSPSDGAAPSATASTPPLTESPTASALLQRPATGFVDVEGGRVAYWIRGSGERTPLLVLHGGPGIPHDYLENLSELGDERPVVFYDQLGCGLSDRPDDPSLWTRERFARELATVRSALGLDEVVLYGHSWGTILAVDYLSGLGGSRPTGVRGVILASPALDMKRWMADGRRLVATLPEDTAQAIADAERTGQTDSDAYRAAMHEFYSRYVIRRDPWPPEVERALQNMGEQVYGTMNGPSEFTITGTLATVDVTPQLADLHLPTLYLCGSYDEATPDSTRFYAGLTPGAETVVIDDAAHLANYDQPERTLAALRDWLDRNGL